MQLIRYSNKKNDIIESYKSGINVENRNQCKIRKHPNLKLNEAIQKFYNTARGRGVTLSGTIIKEQALEYAKNLRINDFKASDGWLSRFKSRNSLTFVHFYQFFFVHLRGVHFLRMFTFEGFSSM